MQILQSLFIALAIAVPTPVQATTTQPLPPVLERIAKCESRNDPHQKNLNSSASGRFQFIWGTWNTYGKKLWGNEFYTKNIWSYEDNTELALWVYTNYGTKDWDASKKCWQPLTDG